MPDRLDVNVSSGCNDELDCACEMVDQDKTTKQYVCSYQMINGSANTSKDMSSKAFDGKEERQIEDNLAQLVRDTHLNRTGLKRCASLGVKNKTGPDDLEEMPDRLEMKVSSGCSEEMDCVCEMVDQDKTTKQYVCRYQMTNGSANSNSDSPPGDLCDSAGGKASIIEGKFALNLPYVNYHILVWCNECFNPDKSRNPEFRTQEIKKYNAMFAFLLKHKSIIE